MRHKTMSINLVIFGTIHILVELQMFCFVAMHSIDHFLAIGRFPAKSPKNNYEVCESLHRSGFSLSFQEGTKTFSEL